MNLLIGAIFYDIGDPESIVMVLARLSIAVLLGAVVGFERQVEGKSAGMRTHMLVALGSALFTLAPLYGGMAIADLSRVIQGVATGIGFLGAGAIMKAGEERIHGLTTAASIWLTAAAGLSVGAGYVLPAAIAILLGWLVLEPMQWVEKRFLKSRRPNP